MIPTKKGGYLEVTGVVLPVTTSTGLKMFLGRSAALTIQSISCLANSASRATVQIFFWKDANPPVNASKQCLQPWFRSGANGFCPSTVSPNRKPIYNHALLGRATVGLSRISGEALTNALLGKQGLGSSVIREVRKRVPF